jgi:gliding motility-associated-like protein
MGDITITFICPNGQSIAVHQQGGGGTQLGEPIDGGDETTGQTPGIGYDYYWAPDATAGTWEEYGDGTGGTVPAGTYESAQPWDVLVGCPLNGTWTVEICDMWGADDGYIFDWGMAFNPQLYGDLMQFTPIYGPGCDSSWWEGPNIVNTEFGCDFICIEINETGTYDYTYTVINNFGCTFDTTIAIDVYVASIVTAGPDMIFNCDPIMLQGGLDGGLTADCSDVAGNYEQCFDNAANWVQTYCPNNPGDGVSYLTIDFNSGMLETCCDELYIYDGPSTGSPILAGPLTGDFAGLSYAATASEGCLTIQVTTDFSGSCVNSPDFYTPINYDISCGENQVPFVWLWSPTTGLSDPTIPNPMMDNVGSDITYTLSGYPVGYPGCGSSDEMHVTIDPSLPNTGLDTQIGICPEADLIIMLDALDGNPDAGGTWTTAAGTVIAGEFNPAIDTPGDFYYTIAIDGCSLSTELQIDLQYPEISVDSDTTICENGEATLHAWSETDYDNSYNYFWSNNSTAQQISVQPGVSDDYWVYAIDGADCMSDTAWVSVDYYSPLSLTAMNDTTICAGANLYAHVGQYSGGLEPYTFTWTYNNTSIGSGEGVNHSPNVQGEYCVTLSDVCETTPVQACSFGFIQTPVAITIEADTTNSCSPLETTISLTTPANLYQQTTWEFEDGANFAMMDEVNHSISTPGTYDLTVSLVTISGCEFTQTFPDYLTVYPDPVAGWIADPQPTTIEDAEIQFTNMSSGTGIQSFWIFNTDDPFATSYAYNPLIQFPEGQGGEYNVRLLIKDQNQCTDMIEGIIDINDILQVFIPNTVTPNSDGVNDVLFVEGADIDPKEFEFVIFNRWGDLVFHSTDPTLPWTCGRNDGDYFVPDGVYNYVVKAKSESTGDARLIKGFVTVLR